MFDGLSIWLKEYFEKLSNPIKEMAREKIVLYFLSFSSEYSSNSSQRKQSLQKKKFLRNIPIWNFINK